MKQRLFVSLAFLGLLSSCGGVSNSSSSSSSNQSGSYVSYSDPIKNIENCGVVTGANAKTDTTFYGVGGCDLGFPMYDSSRKQMLTFFGDTFTTPLQSGRWRSNTMGVSTDANLSDGYDFDSFISSSSGIAKPAIEGHHADKYEMTKIPTGAIEISGVYYMFYFSKYSWNVPQEHSMNYGGAVKSTDGGETWQRVYDLTWVDHVIDDDSDKMAECSDVLTLINEDADLQPNKGNLTLAEHEGYRFTEVFPLDGKDGYVYLFGMGGYRSSWISLARVTYANIEKWNEIEYLTSYSESNEPVWTKGRDGLDALSKSEEGYCLESTGSEMSVMYSAAKKRWLIFMASSSSGQYGTHYFESENIFGPYQKKGTLVLPSSSPLLPQNSTYAPMVHEKWTEDDGYTFYMFVSTWMPNYNPNLFKVEFN